MKREINRYPGDVKAWWQSAIDDVKWTKHDFDGGFYNQACLGAQQIVEKSLKTYLLSQNIKVEKTHDLVRLLAQAKKKDKRFNKFLDHCKLLDKYYVDTRYPRFGVKGDWTEAEAKEALSLAKEVLAFVGEQTKPVLE